MHSFVCPPWIYWAKTGADSVLLDTSRGIYHSLNQSATVLWELLIQEQHDLAEAITSLAERYALSVNQAETDLSTFIENMLHQGLLSRCDDRKDVLNAPSFPAISHSVRRLLIHCGVLEAYVLLNTLHEVLQHPHALIIMAQHLAGLPVHADASPTLVKRLHEKIALAAAWHPQQCTCLHQSIALCWMLRTRGIAADFVLGVYKRPFSAHAWVESNGERVQWEAGMSYPDENFVRALAVIFHSGQIALSGKAGQ